MGVRTDTRRPPMAGRSSVTSNSSPRRQASRGPSARKVGTSSGEVSPSTSRESGFTMPAFSAAMRWRQSPRPSVWSWPMLVTTATSASTTLVAS